MSEPIRTSPAKRQHLAAALKRNMARRKAVGSRKSPVASEASATSPLGESLPRTGYGVEKRPSRFTGEGMLPQPVATSLRKDSAS